jgi:hypothetical protein
VYRRIVLFGRDEAHELCVRAGSSYLLRLGEGRLMMLNSIGSMEGSSRVPIRRGLTRLHSQVVPSVQLGLWGIIGRPERLWPVGRNSSQTAYLEER